MLHMYFTLKQKDPSFNDTQKQRLIETFQPMIPPFVFLFSFTDLKGLKVFYKYQNFQLFIPSSK